MTQYGPTDNGIVVPTDTQGGAMNAGVAPTTPSSVDENQISPNTTVTAPPTQPTPANGSPAGNPPAQQKPQPTQPHPVSRMFDGILKNLSGGPITVTDPVTGERREVPQSRGTIGKSILAAALAGLMTPTAYRETPYGPVVDTGNTLAGAGAAGLAARQNREQQAQKLSDDQQAKKLMVLTNNAKLVQLQAASAHANHVMMQDNLANSETFLSAFQDYDKVRTPDQPPAFMAQGLSAEDILAPNSGHKLTDSNVVMDDVRQVYNPETKQMEEHPTYAILNPALGDIQLPKEVTDKLAEMNSQWKDIHRVVGGNVRVPVNAYVSAMHDYQAVTQGQNVLNTVAQEVGGKTGFNLAAAVRANRNLLQPLNLLTQAGAGGNTVNNRPDNLLDTILKAPNGADLLKLMGMTPDQADQKLQQYANKRISAVALAKEGGMGDKSPAPQGMVASQIDAVNNADLPPEIKKTLLAGIPELHGGQSNTKQAEDFRNRVLTAMQTKLKEDIQAGNPEQIANQAKLTIGAGDLTSAKDIYSARGNVKAAYNQVLQQKAIDLGLDPNHYNVEALKTKAKALDDYSAGGKVGQQLTAFKTFGEHVAGAKEANDAWQRSGSPDLNKGLDWWAQHAANDQNYKRFVASVIAPAKEYMNFLNANRAEHEADIKALEPLLDDKQTAQSIFTALQTFARTADDRALALGETYRDTVGTTFPGLISKSTVDNFKKLGVDSRAANVSSSLPRAQSWVSNLQPQKLNPANPQDKAIAQRFAAAAGYDPDKATSMAKEHGYLLNFGQ
jgi:hypothetical protein